MENIYLDRSNELGVKLLSKNLIDQDDLRRAMIIQQGEKSSKSRNLAQILVEDLEFPHDKIFSEVADLYAFRKMSLDLEKLNEEKIKEFRSLIKYYKKDLIDFMLEHKTIPIKYDEIDKEKLIIASVDPTKKEIKEILYRLNATKNEVTFIPEYLYNKLIELIFPPENEFLNNLEDSQEDLQLEKDEHSVDEDLIQIEINKSALVNLFEGALIEGVRKNASDVHIVPEGKKKICIYFRIDGKLVLWHVKENTMPEAIAAVVKDRSRGFDRFERETAQDGFIQRKIDNSLIRFRVSILPIVGTEFLSKYERVVIRILDDRNVITDLTKLGLSGHAREVFDKAINQPQGMVILTGPTGCGKSTTLIAALHQVIDPSVNVLTVEDPVEYVIHGAAQLKLSFKMNFEQAMRSILRHDPDIVFVGEIRDKVTADIAIKLANTGHLTFSTLHTNDAPSAISRLYKMGVEPFLLAYAINLIVAQRLIRKLCECKVKMNNLDPSFFKLHNLDIEEWKNYDLYEAKGCKKCAGTGYKGRMAIHEALYITKEIKQLIYNAGEEIDEENIKLISKKEGTLSLRECGFEKVKLGLTSFAEVIANSMED